MPFNLFNKLIPRERERESKPNERLRFILISAICGLLTIAIVNIVYAWTNPSNNPPSGGGALYYRAGNVGIGTTAPGGKLDVSASGANQCCPPVQSTVSLAEASNTTGRRAWLQFHNAGEAEAYIRLAGGGPAGSGREGLRRIEIGDNQGVNTSLTVTGNVGIGTTAPGYKLDVAGEIRATGGTPIYSCPYHWFSPNCVECTNSCVGQLTTNSTCVTLTGGGAIYQTFNCTLVGRLVAP